VFLLNNSGNYDLVGVVQFFKGPDNYVPLIIPTPSQYITSSGTVNARVKMERNSSVNFHVATDILRLRTKARR
jgi:hypothetical protein